MTNVIKPTNINDKINEKRKISNKKLNSEGDKNVCNCY